MLGFGDFASNSFDSGLPGSIPGVPGLDLDALDFDESGPHASDDFGNYEVQLEETTLSVIVALQVAGSSD